MNIGAKFYSFNDVARLENGQVVVAWPTHIDNDGTCSLHFVVNNAIMAIDATVAILAITYEAGTNQVKNRVNRANQWLT